MLPLYHYQSPALDDYYGPSLTGGRRRWRNYFRTSGAVRVHLVIHWLISCSVKSVYVVWAYVPESWLFAVGLTYWPQKYWAVALPVYLCVVILLFYLAYLGLIFINTSSLTSVTIITDDQANLKDPGPLPAEAIPPLRDLDIVEVNRCLYLDS